jgi:hypothetical protein
MTDEEIIEIAASFRDGLLDGKGSTLMCAAVSWPLASLLRSIYKVGCDTVESDLGEINHIWIRLDDGRALDATADQFGDYPPVYLGPPLEALHR